MGHGGNAQIRAVGDEGGQQGDVEVGDTRSTFTGAAKDAREVTPGIDLGQQVLNPHAR